jgi:hypothetical protein
MLSVILVHAQQIVGGCAMIINVFPKTFKNVFSRETIILNFSQYFIVKFKVIVVLIKE